MEEEIRDEDYASEVPNVTEEVTDKDLNDAYDTLFGIDQEVVEPEPETNIEVTQPDIEISHEDDNIDQVEKSRLGRKVKELKDNMATKEDLAQILAKLDELRTVQKPVETEISPEVEEEISDITNVQELNQYLDKYIEKREARKVVESTEKVKKYRENYMSTLSDLGKNLDREDFVEVFNTMKEKYNDVSWNDPVSECASNFSKALVEIMKSKKSINSNKFEQNRDKSPPSVNTPSNISVNTVELPELDPIAAEFIRKVGMTDESVKRALSGEIKPGLTGSRIKIK